ncbi:MAG TPA: M6 family metalloprotease domain-containing protein, partial [Candidatus Edwardsbacteria bacterium]|nr:M6 family metalloprotease domain-containing protein [Candidatus Edwardsbacteria bacterium]
MKRTITILPAALLLAAAAAAMPPRPGVTPPAALIEAIAAGRIDNPAQGLLADQMAKGGPAKISGSRSYPVVLGYFSDSGSTYSQAQFQAMLFSSGAGVKSVNNYYRDMSFSAMSCSGSVASWYTSGHTVAYYGGGNNGLNPGTTGNAYEFIRSVLAQADAAVDFSRPEYDLNNDGYVDVVWVVHAGRGGEEEPDANHNWIWSHSSSLNGWGGGATYYTTNDPWPGHTGQYVKINKYIIMPEKTLYSGESNAMIGCGVFAHEFGHALGLVDLYDVAVTSSSTVPGYGMGLYSLMAAGSWGGDYSSGARPVALDLWSRRFLGWCSPQLVSANGAYTVNATLATASSSSFKLAKQGQDTTGQFWLVENRCKNAQGTFSGVRWDSLLYGQGLAIYHVDMAYADTASGFFKSNHVNSNSTSGTTRNRPYGVALEETDDTTADYTSGLWWGLGAPGDAADLWNSSTQGSFDSTGTNYPTSLLNDGITRSGISITGIPAASAAMACVFNVFLTMPELNIGLLQNPAFSYSLGISMVSNHRLLSPDNLDTANLIFNGGAPQRLNFIHPTASTFQAGYTLQTTGSYVIRIASRDSDSTMVYRSGQRSFTVIAAKAA